MGSVIENIKEKINTSPMEKYIEDIKIVDFEFKVQETSFLKKEKLQEILMSFPDRDTVEITILNEANDGVQISKNCDWDNIDLDVYAEDTVQIIGHIEKAVSRKNIISIYNYERFCESFLKKDILNIMSIFSKLLAEREEILFEVQDLDINCMTNSIHFSSSDSVKIARTRSRNDMLQLVKDNAGFRNISMYSLLPDDFSFQIIDSNNKLDDIFGKIETLLAICYIANDAEIIDESRVAIRIFGQRNISSEINIKDIIFNKEIVKIYNWIYCGGNTTDKAVIARNIISLHCRYSNLLNLDGKTYSSIQSNFNLYQKDNVDRYLNLKNDVGKSVTDIIEKSNDLAFDIPRGLKNNVLAVFTFLFTVILANIVSNAPLDNIFTRDITVIFEIIILFSFAFLLLNIYETNYKIERMQRGFEKLKNNYEDVFDEQELSELMNEDSFYKSVINNIKKQRNWAIVIWIVLLIALLIAIELISSAPTLDYIIAFLKRSIKKTAV